MLARFRVDGQVAIVTGAGRGIGRAIALALAEAGADLALAARSAEQLEDTAHAVCALGRRALAVPTDVTSTEQINHLADRTASELGHIDILVNNAGSGLDAFLIDMTDEQWYESIDTNLTSAFRCCRAVGRYVIPRRRGKVINVASMMAFDAAPMFAAYCASKAGILGLTRALALEWARYNIQVNTLAPGYAYTGINVEALKDRAFHDRLVRAIPQKRIADPEDIAPAALFLASSASDYMTGATIVVDGGYIIR